MPKNLLSKSGSSTKLAWLKKLWTGGEETFSIFFCFLFFHFFKQSSVSKGDSNIICASTKKKQICQVWRVWVKKSSSLTPWRRLKWSMTWQPYFQSYKFQILWKVEFWWVQKLVKIWRWYLKPLLRNWYSTRIYHLP